jgi:circadian clock protein KaiB
MSETNKYWHLTLYVAGTSGKSATAIRNLKNYCAEHAEQSFEIEIIDLLQHPHLAEKDQILAIPTLVRKIPKPMRKIIGDLSNSEKVMMTLELKFLKNKNEKYG